MDAISSSILQPLCEMVINAAMKEYRLVRDVKDEIRKLRTTVSMIMEVLEDAERKKDGDGHIRTWLKSLKQVLFLAEDVFDEIATDDEALGRSRRRSDAEDGTTQSAVFTGRLSKVRSKLISCLCSVNHIRTRSAIAHRIKYINEEFDHISKSRENLGLSHVSNETSWSVFRITSSQLSSCDAHIVGRVDEMQKMEELLLENSTDGTVAAISGNYKNVHVINVVGIGGLGKTTLVKHAYNSPVVAEYFHPKMWVCVSNDFDVKRITIEIMDAAASSFKEPRDEFVNSLNFDVVQKRLQDKLEGKRFLLVLDDVWEENFSKWDSLCTPLMYGGKGSKIIVTTRIQSVSNITKGTSMFLTDLPSEDLWTILQNYAFDGHDPNTQLAQVGREIVKKLKGSPLAARTIGRVLNASLDVRHWTNILSSKAWVSSDSEDSILPILKLSYDHLPGHLKQCFALCSLFPEDHEFDKDELVQLWMAHQIIRIREDFFHVESEGSEYLDKLVHMSLFEKVTNIYGKERFVMHDLIQNLANSVSKDDCLRLEDNQQNGTIPETIRHVSIASDKFDLPKIEQLCNKYENMRTLLFLRGCKFQLDSHLDNIFIKLQRLRVLRLSGCGIKMLPASIGALKHLRLLDLSGNLISKLPDTLCKLRNLQVLKLKGCSRLRALPQNTSALVNLRHLELDTEIASCVPGLGKLTALQELIVNGSKVGELADMGMLKELRIWGLEGVATQEEVVRARLEAKAHLELLELKWCQSGHNRPRQHSVSEEEEEVVDALKPVNRIGGLSVTSYEGARSPKWMGDPSWVSTSLLVKVKLFNCRKWEVLPPLGQLPYLKVLTISDMSGVRRIGPEFFFSCCCCDDGEGGVKLASGFPSLEELEFREMPEWEEWESPVALLEQQQQHPSFFPRLRTLDLFSCEKLRELPPLPPTLTTLGLYNVGLTRLPGWMERCSDDDIGRADVVMMPSTSTSSSSPSLLSTLKIYNCPNITSLDDGLLQRPLRMLKKLNIVGCEELASLPAGGVFRQLDSLEELRVRNCPKLVLWPVPSAATEEDAPLPSSLKSVRLEKLLTGGLQLLLGGGGLQKLTSLTSLDVDVSSSDTFGALIPSTSTSTSLTHLGIRGRDDDDDHVDGGGALMSTWLQGLIVTCNSLTTLCISNFSAITTLPSSEAVLRRLSALESLRIGDCGELRSLLGGAAGLVSLEELSIRNCPKLLHLVEEEGGGAAAAVTMSSSPVIPSSSPVVVVAKKIISLKTLRAESCSPKQIATWLRQVSSLQELTIWGCPQLRCFGAGPGDDDTTINAGDLDQDLDLEGALLDLAPSLRQLHIRNCENLSSLPSKLRSLTRLEFLEITNCPKIQRLPSAGLPQTLKHLVIWRCPELARRCREEGCPDWPLLAHIPYVAVL